MLGKHCSALRCTRAIDLSAWQENVPLRCHGSHPLLRLSYLKPESLLCCCQFQVLIHNSDITRHWAKQPLMYKSLSEQKKTQNFKRSDARVRVTKYVNHVG
jgi:hypothetical protein